MVGVVNKYNRAYHSAIRSTPTEAWEDKSGVVQIENSNKGSYAKRFIVRNREKFEVGQEVRIARRENLGNQMKEEKGRFLREGKIIEKCGNDAYLVKEKDKIYKKCHYDLKRKNSLVVG